MLEPDAYYDALYVVAKLGSTDPAPSGLEVHLISYLGCLLSLYDGRPVSEWGYRLAMAEGRPFAAELEFAIVVLESKAFVTESEDGDLRCTKTGEMELAKISRFSLARRQPYLQGACAAALTLPQGMLRSALMHDAQLRPLSELGSSRNLFEGPAIETMHQQFNELRMGVGAELDELMVPATLWLAFYSEVARISFLREQENDGG